MLTTHAINPNNNANNPASTAPDPVLATYPPPSGGRVVSSSTGERVVSSKGREQSKADLVIPHDSLIGRLTAEAQAARDAFGYGTVTVDGKVYRMREDWWEVADRAAVRFGEPVATHQPWTDPRARLGER